jgi:hypothetical protein
MRFWLDCMKNSQLLGHLFDGSELEELVNFGSPRSDNLNLEVQSCSFPTFSSATRKCFCFVLLIGNILMLLLSSSLIWLLLQF